jgi:hypothetical protein
MTYKLRIDADKVDSTKRIEDRLTRYQISPFQEMLTIEILLEMRN